ncbi:MAG: M3 family oligoendopeptidase [Bacteroidales bacterium]
MDNRYSPGQRAFLPPDRKVESWESVRPFFDELANRKITSPVQLERWLVDRSALLSWMEEELAWRYIRTNCDTTRKELARHYEQFVTGIEPHIHRYTHLFDKKLVNSPHLSRLGQKKYAVLIRAARKRIELFREENIPLLAELQVEEQEYGKIISELTVLYRDREYTLQQAANFLRNPDREVRETVYRLIQEQRISKAFSLQDLFTRLVRKRYKIALNAGYRNFRDYQFDNLGRFDYRPEDCMQFHESVQHEVMPLVDRMLDRRKEQLRLNELRPWDLDVDVDGKPPLVPASGSEELLQKTILCFSQVREKYGSMLKQLAGRGFLDLDSRKGKAPGGFNYPLYESNVPFIFMNAAGNLRDLETLVHEGGHAIHSIMTSGLELIDFKELPAEVAELASMSMELISMEHWDVFFPDESDLRRARIHQLEGIVQVLPWIAAVDHFQHWVYLNPEHQEKERLAAWNRIYRRFSSDRINWSGMEENFVYSWQRQLHIFELPFYYIEYGMAQLGAIALWKHYKNDPENTLDCFESALRLGYTATIPEIYATAGIRFDFSPEYIRTLLEFVWKELQSLYL